MATTPTPFDVYKQNPSDEKGFLEIFGNNSHAKSMWKTLSNAGKNGSSSSSTSSIPSMGNTSGGSGSNGSGFFGTLSKIFEPLNNAYKGALNIGSNVYGSQMGQDNRNQNLDEVTKLFEMVKEGGLNPIKLFSEGMKLAGGEIIDQLKQESELKSEINSKTTLSGNLSQDLRDDIEQSSIYAAKFDFSMKDLGELYTTLVDQSGKYSLINKEVFELAAPTVKVFGTTMEGLAQTMIEFEKVGIGAEDTIKTIDKAGHNSMSLGLSGKKVAELIQKNVETLNSYGFQKGIDGLKTMIQKSLEFRTSMESVYTIADKVMDPDKAIELTANLQVLGGAIGDFNDPLKLMYMATNNVEGLQDALVGAAKGLATYNQEQGRFEITGINLRKARAMAQELGIDYKELAKGAIAAAERSSVASAMMANGLNIKDKDKEFLTNISRMEGGEMKIMVPESIADKLGVPTKIALDKLDQKTADALLKNQEQIEGMDSEKLAQNQLTTTQAMARDMAVVAAYYKVRAAQSITGISEGLGVKKAIEELHDKILGIERDNKNDKTNYREVSKKAAIEFKENPAKTIEDAIKNSDLSPRLKQIGVDIIEGGKNLYDKLINKEKEVKTTVTPTETNSKLEVTHKFESTNTLQDGISNLYAKRPDLLMAQVSVSHKEYVQ